jgi:hypothetical protein
LLAPRGDSRRTLAEALAAHHDGQVRPVWHQDSEPSLVPRLGRFLHLTQGFDVVLRTGAVMCTLVDDVTIVADLDPTASAQPGWHRILTDDPRLLRLLAASSDPGGRLETSLDAAAALWREASERHGNIWRLDSAGATVALATAAGGERERPCEIVTPPLVSDHAAALAALLGPARDLGFTVPREAAVHVHLDGKPFRDPNALANVIRLFAHWREPLRELLQTNPHCRRLAPLPAPLVDLTDGEPDWEQLTSTASAAGLSKFYDVNLTQVLRDAPLRDTLEVRILPGSLDVDAVMAGAAMVETLLDRCLQPQRFPDPPVNPGTAVDVLRELASDR